MKIVKNKLLSENAIIIVETDDEKRIESGLGSAEVQVYG